MSGATPREPARTPRATRCHVCNGRGFVFRNCFPYLCGMCEQSRKAQAKAGKQ